MPLWDDILGPLRAAVERFLELLKAVLGFPNACVLSKLRGLDVVDAGAEGVLFPTGPPVGFAGGEWGDQGAALYTICPRRCVEEAVLFLALAGGLETEATMQGV